MSIYFTDKSLKFLRGLARHNDKAWFTAHKHDYETHVREPFQRLLADLQPDLMAVSAQFRADPRKIGGSLFRIYPLLARQIALQTLAGCQPVSCQKA